MRSFRPSSGRLWYSVPSSHAVTAGPRGMSTNRGCKIACSTFSTIPTSDYLLRGLIGTTRDVPQPQQRPSSYSGPPDRAVTWQVSFFTLSRLRILESHYNLLKSVLFFELHVGSDDERRGRPTASSGGCTGVENRVRMSRRTAPLMRRHPCRELPGGF